MIFPFESLSEAHREAGLVAGTLIGFGFGFVLERAGFGRAPKLAAQFYGTDLTVLKVMFGAIVTALVGLTVLSGLGLADFRAIADSAASGTFLWPMIAGGFALGVGFIVSGYCPGTSFVAAASGKLDGMLVVLGVILGQLAYAELEPKLSRFHDSGDLGHLYLPDVLHLPTAVVAALVVAMAVGAFLVAQKIEGQPVTLPGRAVFAGFAGVAVLGLATLAVPARASESAGDLPRIGQLELARRVLESPWRVRVVDVRTREECVKQRIPGAECTPLEKVQRTDERDIVLVAQGTAPRVSLPGRVYALDGGFDGWREFALKAPPPGSENYTARAAIHAAMTGMKAAPPPPPPTAGAAPKKGGGGGCGG